MEMIYDCENGEDKNRVLKILWSGLDELNFFFKLKKLEDDVSEYFLDLGIGKTNKWKT